MTDLLIVGRGLAASVLMHTCYRYNISFTVVGTPALSSCSAVAAGIWNPIVFKRMTESWKAAELVPFLHDFYSSAGKGQGKKFITSRRILRLFSEEQEKILWRKKAAGELAQWLSPDIEPGDLLHGSIRDRTEFAYVNGAGNLDVKGFLDFTSSFFSEFITTEVFEHKLLQLSGDSVTYKDITAQNAVFCEGVKVSENPFFDWIPLKPAKGEILDVEITAPLLDNDVLNRAAFLLPLGENRYRVGATYEWQELNEVPTAGAYSELTGKLERMISTPFKVTGHQAGIRPASLDRRPIIGRHPRQANLFVFNGLGAKGVMLAPFFANNFVLFYLQKQDLDPAVNCSRFYTLYGKKN